jgi:DNA replication protein DnaC
MSGCTLCGGIGFRYETRGDREAARRCECQIRRRFDIANSDDRVAACQIPPSCRSHSFGTFTLKTPVLQKAFESALAYCQNFESQASDTGAGLLFWGPRGTGKTHLAVATLLEIVSNHRVTGRMWNFSDLIKEIGRSYDSASFTADMHPLRSALKADVLLLDDLASKKIPDWGFNALFEIIDARYRECRPTLITTIYEDVDPRAALAADGRRRDEYLTERVTARIRSRLLEMCTFVPTRSDAERAALQKPKRATTLRAIRGQSRS